MNAFRSSFVKSAARGSTALAALFAFHSALAVDEYVVYGKRAPLIGDVDRAALRSSLGEPVPGAEEVVAGNVRAALAEALRAAREPSSLRFASNDQRPRA